MKTGLLFLILVLSSFVANAHEYFFAFAEVEYNTTTKCLEMTVQGSAHDVEDVLNESGIPIKELEDHYTDSLILLKLETFINSGLVFSSNGITPQLMLKGYEVKTNGMVYFYLASAAFTPQTSIDIQFDWLMNVLDKQQNKLTFNYLNHKYNAVFLPQQRRFTIQFEQK